MKVPNTILECYTEPTGNFRYKGRDGYYYNGYALSSDCADDFFGDAVKEMIKDLEKDLGLTGFQPVEKK